MTAPRDTDRRINAWLDLMPDEAPDHVVGTILEDVALTPQDRVPWFAWPRDRARRSRLPAIALVAVLAIAALLGTLLLAGGALRRDALPSAIPTVPSASVGVASPAPTASTAAAGGPAADLEGAWIADRPAGLDMGSGDAPRMTLVVDAGGASIYVRDGDDPRDHVASDLELVPEGLRLASRAQDASVTLDGDELRGCTAGEAGTWAVERGADGLTMALSPVDDPCPARSAALERTWTRSLGHANRGGLGVVDAFDPLFVAEIPPGSYSIERTTDALTIVQPVPEFQLLAFLDPQGFNDPCDPAGGGRRAIEPGADALVDYFRELDGLTVDDVSELEVDGLRAVRVVLHADLEIPCADGLVNQFQPAALSPGDQNWVIRPGVVDSLVIVEHPKGTLMFEVLPAPNDLEDQVIGSIRFLDQLPEAP